MDTDFKKPWAIMVMGRPGAGKDTQAEILAKRMNLVQIVTSDLLQKKFGENPDDPEIQKEQKIFESGELNTPSWVLQAVKEHVQDLAGNNFNGKGGIIFGGSPRTMHEAESLTPLLINLFGEDKVLAFYLDIPQEVGIERILKRSARPLDRDPEKLKIRMAEYDTRTRPVLDYLDKLNMLIKIDGTPKIEDVAQEIKQKLENRFQ